MHLFYGARAPEELCLSSYLEADPQLRECLQVTPVISEIELATQAGGEGAVGYVHEHLLQTIGEQLADYEIYFCGPPPMIDALAHSVLVEYKVPFEQVHFDRFF